MKWIIPIFCAFILIGCASQNTTDLGGYTLVKDSAYENPLPELDSPNDYGEIVVRRDSGFAGSALRAKLHLNGVGIINLRPGEYVELKVNPGEYKLTLNSNGFALLPVETKVIANIKVGSRAYYRVLPIWGGGMQIKGFNE